MQLVTAIGMALLAGLATPAIAGDSDQPPPDQLLLKDYRPESIYKVPRTRVEKARFPVIDIHSHPYAKTEAQVDQWAHTMDEVGVVRTIVMVGAAGKRFDDTVALFKKHADKFEIWCGIDYTGYDQPGFAERAIAELERCRRAGARGVGELSDKGRGLVRSPSGAGDSSLHIDDPRMDPILERCADLGLPVNIHVGEDLWMYQPMDPTNDGLMNSFTWRIPNDPAVLRHDEVVATLERAVKKHRRTTFIACHFANCCSDLSILARMLDGYPNLYADNAARYAETSPIPRFVAKFYEKYQNRLLYGTDMGYAPEMYRTTFRILESEDEHFYDHILFTYTWPLHGLGLPNGVLKKVYGANANRILSRTRATGARSSSIAVSSMYPDNPLEGQSRSGAKTRSTH